MNTPPATKCAQGGAAILAALALAACSAFERKVEYVPYEVKVPIAVPCSADPGPEPQWATGSLHKADDLDTKAKALLEEREQRIGFEDKLKAANSGCQ